MLVISDQWLVISDQYTTHRQSAFIVCSFLRNLRDQRIHHPSNFRSLIAQAIRSIVSQITELSSNNHLCIQFSK